MFPDTPGQEEGIGAASPARIAAAYQTLSASWPGSAPAKGALYSVLAVSGVESGYGVGFGEGVNNWGAIQCAHGPPCGDACIAWGDKHSDGSGYTWCYKRYPSPADGARDLADLLLRRVDRATLDAADPQRLATAMFRARYFEGIGPTEQDRILWYTRKLDPHFRAIRESLGGSDGPSGGGWAAATIGAAALAFYALRRRGRG